MSIGDIIAILAIVGTIFSLFLQGRTGNVELALKLRKEMQADREEYRAEIDTLKGRIITCENNLETERVLRRKAEQKTSEYLGGIFLLTDQLIENDLVPRWKPNQTGPLAKQGAA